MIRNFCRDIYHELLKMSSQKKNYIAFAGYLLFVVLCSIAFVTSTDALSAMLGTVEMNRENAARYLDGFFFARMLLVPTFIILMPLVMAALGGDCIAGESQENSLKLYMTRPRSRTRLVLTKFVSIYISGLFYTLFFACAGLLVGLLCFGLAPVQILLVPGRVFGAMTAVMENSDALIRYFATALYFSFSLMTLGSIALFLSTIFNRMSSAAIAVLTFYFVSYVVASLPISVKLRPYLVSEIMNNAFLFWLTPFPTGKLCVNLATLAIYITAFLLASVISFNFKDIR
ncbi:MAG: ABC transporter permease subunit [Lentisphaeria bacterium]|nr:ABC transporter permease subunit [Lentisphaeria bacterium]